MGVGMFRSWRLRITVITALITLVAVVPGLASAAAPVRIRRYLLIVLPVLHPPQRVVGPCTVYAR